MHSLVHYELLPLVPGKRTQALADEGPTIAGLDTWRDRLPWAEVTFGHAILFLVVQYRIEGAGHHA
jgi:hypothetical protein